VRNGVSMMRSQHHTCWATVFRSDIHVHGRSKGWVLYHRAGLKPPVWGGYVADWWCACSTSAF